MIPGERVKVGAEVDADVSKCPSPAPEGDVPVQHAQVRLLRARDVLVQGHVLGGSVRSRQPDHYCRRLAHAGLTSWELDGRCCAGTIGRRGM